MPSNFLEALPSRRAFSFESAMAYASHLYRDPMEIVAARQAREQRQPKPKPARKPDPVSNSPLPDYPRRWLDAMAQKAWSPARQAAEAQFARGLMESADAKSEARKALEALFEQP